jgi:hypothetical protein
LDIPQELSLQGHSFLGISGAPLVFGRHDDSLGLLVVCGGKADIDGWNLKVCYGEIIAMA